MELAAFLEIRPGVTAVIGGGGKTTLLRALGEELARKHRVLLCTTTRIFPFPQMPCAGTLAELDALRGEYRLLCAGRRLPGIGKLAALDASMADLAARFDYVLVEADGSAQRPLKAHGGCLRVWKARFGGGPSAGAVRTAGRCFGDGDSHSPDRGTGPESGGTA